MTIATILAQAPAGVVEGGWGYVTAAYVITWLFFVGYAASLVTRERAARAALEVQDEPGGPGRPASTAPHQGEES